MSVESLENNIYRCRKQMEYYESQIADIQKNIKELEALETQYIEISREFRNRNESSIQKLVSMKRGDMTLRAVGSYINGMFRMLNSNEYEDAQEGLTESRRIIARRIQEYDKEIVLLQDNIEDCMRDIHHCYRAIEDIKAKEAAEVV